MPKPFVPADTESDRKSYAPADMLLAPVVLETIGAIEGNIEKIAARTGLFPVTIGQRPSLAITLAGSNAFVLLQQSPHGEETYLYARPHPEPDANHSQKLFTDTLKALKISAGLICGIGDPGHRKWLKGTSASLYAQKFATGTAAGL